MLFVVCEVSLQWWCGVGLWYWFWSTVVGVVVARVVCGDVVYSGGECCPCVTTCGGRLVPVRGECGFCGSSSLVLMELVYSGGVVVWLGWWVCLGCGVLWCGV